LIEIRNLLFQPVTFHQAGTGRGLYLGPRERRLVEKSEISPEIELAARRGLVTLAPEARRPIPVEAPRKRRKGGKG